MIRALLNLSCDRGHRFFSPTPSAWRGKDCAHVEEGTRRRCNRPLHVTRDTKRKRGS